MSVSNSSITTNIPNGTVYHFNPYANQGNLPWTVVPAAGTTTTNSTSNSSPASVALSPAPKVSLPPTPVAFVTDDDGLSQNGSSLGSSSGATSPSNASFLPQPLRHHVPQARPVVSSHYIDAPQHIQRQQQHEQHQFNSPPPQQQQQQLHYIQPRQPAAMHYSPGAIMPPSAAAVQQQQNFANRSNSSSFSGTGTGRMMSSSSLPMTTSAQGNVHNKLETYPVKYVSYDTLRQQQMNHGQQHYYQQSAEHVPTVRLFVGQVLHELRPAELSNLFCLLAGTSSAKVVPHGPGCFFIELPAAQFRNARQLNARVLFDVHGLWFAEGQEEAKVLQEYVASVKQGMKTMRLPRSTLVVRR